MAMWYDECKDNHPSCSRPRVVSEVTLEISGREEAPEPKLPPDTRFIDVQKMCLVMAKNDCGYVALSYVWGNSDNEGFHTKMQNVVAREADNGLRKLMFPKTIADAISLTAELGIMYLWVDSICIVQDDDGKATQIQSMDRIYGLASLVIVGAAGIDANMGLTGYANSPRTENEQWVQRVHGVQLMVSSPPFGEVLSASKWSTRGWTFQEWYLARRALVFTDQQVYYVCSSSNFSEDIYLDLVPPVAERVDTSKSISSTVLHQLPKRNSPLTIDSGWTEYRQLVESYTPRELTYESDTLLAISGLLNNLHRARKNRFICGVSVADFHNALFWVPVNGTDFRYVLCGKMFPTWSWVGWKGAVTYGVFPASQQSLVENWIVRRLDGQQELLRTPLSEPQNELFVTSEERVNCKSSTVHNEEEDIERIEDIEESTLGSNYLDYCHLIFEASAAPLQISPGTIDNSSSKADALMSLGGRFVGVALLNYKPKMGAEVLTRQWETYLCIAVSISKDRMPYTFEKAFSQLPEDDEWVNVILVGNREKFYFRAGVGQVSKWRWENYAKPEMKSITLG